MSSPVWPGLCFYANTGGGVRPVFLLLLCPTRNAYALMHGCLSVGWLAASEGVVCGGQCAVRCGVD